MSFRIDATDLPTLFQIAVALDAQQGTLEKQRKIIDNQQEQITKLHKMVLAHNEILGELCDYVKHRD